MAPTSLPFIIPQSTTSREGDENLHLNLYLSPRGLGPSQGSSTGMIIGFSILGIVILLASWLCLKCLTLPPLPAGDDSDREQTAGVAAEGEGGGETNEKKEDEGGAAEGAGEAAAAGEG